MKFLKHKKTVYTVIEKGDIPFLNAFFHGAVGAKPDAGATPVRAPSKKGKK